ncbi:MAG: hydrogenase formation protein HypD [Alphaproteobacteria bacterium]
MKHRDEYRDGAVARALAREIAGTATRPWTLMEVCGGQTHAIVRHGIDRLLPPGLTLVHGPGCPVCVTPVEYVDKAIEIAGRPEVILCSFGDMLRVPGERGDLLAAKSRGADVRAIYSPLDALAIARAAPERQVVLFAVGFETTAPANAMAAYRARADGLSNFSMLVSHVLVPPAMRALLDAPGNRVQGFLAAGHVCTVMGADEYEPIAGAYGVPIVITGFEPVDILEGVLMCVRQLEAGRAVVENQYSRAVRPQGNRAAQQIMREVFRVIPRRWRGIGDIAASGLGLAEAYADLDAERRFGAVDCGDEPAGRCISGAILRGERRPTDCPAFGHGCTPERPLGVTMVSSEGACAAYYRYRSRA